MHFAATASNKKCRGPTHCQRALIAEFKARVRNSAPGDDNQRGRRFFFEQRAARAYVTSVATKREGKAARGPAEIRRFSLRALRSRPATNSCALNFPSFFYRTCSIRLAVFVSTKASKSISSFAKSYRISVPSLLLPRLGGFLQSLPGTRLKVVIVPPHHVTHSHLFDTLPIVSSARRCPNSCSLSCSSDHKVQVPAPPTAHSIADGAAMLLLLLFLFVSSTALPTLPKFPKGYLPFLF